MPGDVGVLPAELKRSSALSAADPDNRIAGLVSASQSAVLAGDSTSDRSADDVVSSSGLLADHSFSAEDARAAGGNFGAGSIDPATELGSGRSSGADEQASSDARMARRSGGHVDPATDAGAADLNSAAMAARGDGLEAAAHTGSQREQDPQKIVAARDVERAARQSAERAADVEAARGQGAGAGRDASSSTEAGLTAGEGVTPISRQGSSLPDVDIGAGNVGVSDSMQRRRGSDEEAADRGAGAGTEAMQARSIGAGQGLDVRADQA